MEDYILGVIIFLVSEGIIFGCLIFHHHRNQKKNLDWFGEPIKQYVETDPIILKYLNMPDISLQSSKMLRKNNEL